MPIGGPMRRGTTPERVVSKRARLRELEKEVRELRLKSEFLGKAAAESTGQCNSAANLSAGGWKSSVLRGRELSFAAMASGSSWVG